MEGSDDDRYLADRVYKVYRSTKSATETYYATVATLLTFLDTNVTYGTTYYYQISAVDGIGEGPRTTEKAPSRANIPTPSRGLTATAGIASATLRWSAPSSNGGANVANYKV